MSNNGLRISGIVFILLFFPLAFFNVLIAVLSTFLGLFLLIYSHNNRQKEEIGFRNQREKSMIEFMANENINYSQLVFDQRRRILLSLNEENNSINVVALESDNCVLKNYKYEDIIQSHIIEDGVSVSKTSRGSQLGGALLGGILAGGTGALIGGLTASKTTVDEVQRIELGIVVNDTSAPLLRIVLLENPTPVKKTHTYYQEQRRVAEHWHHLISVIIKRAETDKNLITPTNLI